MSTTMDELLKKHNDLHKPLEQGQLVEGVVVSNDGRNVLVEIGGKAEGIISKREIDEEKIDTTKFKIGDKIQVVVNQSETDQGFTIVSYKKAAVRQEWKNVESAENQNQLVDAEITDINSGGLVVSFNNLSAFCPVSQLDKTLFSKVKEFINGDPTLRGQRKQELLGQKLRVKIIEVNKKKNRIVVSQKQALSEKNKAKQEEMMATINEGAVFEGKVTNVTPFGIFVDIGDIEGLAHISELSWDHIAHPSQLYSIGDKVKVKVIDNKASQGKLSLSVKALIDNPFKTFADKNKVGAIVKGKVVKIVPYGVFVNLANNVDGFIHVSEITGPSKVGDEIEAKVLEIDVDKKKLALSVKQAK